MTSKIQVIPGKLSETIQKTTDDKNRVTFESKIYSDGDSTPNSEKQEENLDTKQVKETSEDIGGDADTKPHPTEFDFDELVDIVDLNARLSRSINTYAVNTVGLGFNVNIKDGVKNSDKFEEAKKQQRLVDSRLGFPHPKKNFCTLMRESKEDEETIGNGYLEVSRDLKGEIKRLHNIPGQTIWVRDNPERGFKQDIESTGEEKYFKEFGDMRVMNAETGDYEEEEDEEVGFENQANELIHFKRYSTKSRYYGTPRWIPAIPAIIGNRKAAERNVNFFDNDGVPRMMIQVEGGTLTEKSEENIQNFIQQKHKGVDNAHRVMVIEAVDQTENMGPPGLDGKQNNSRINLEPLTVGMEEDASFLEYRKANDEEVREIFGISEAFFSTSDVNRASAEVSRAITNEQEFEPDRKDKEFLINNTIVRDIIIRNELPDEHKSKDLDSEEIRDQVEDIDILVEVEFESPDIGTPEKDQAEVLDMYNEMGALTVNEIREEIGYDPFPDQFDFGQKPLQIALAELQAGISVPINSEGDPLEEDENPRENEGNRSNNDNRGTSNEGEDDQESNENEDLENLINNSSVNKDELAEKLATMPNQDLNEIIQTIQKLKNE